jgi:hypothetical protein
MYNSLYVGLFANLHPMPKATILSIKQLKRKMWQKKNPTVIAAFHFDRNEKEDDVYRTLRYLVLRDKALQASPSNI